MSRLLESDEDTVCDGPAHASLVMDVPEIAAWLEASGSHSGGSSGRHAAIQAGVKVEGGAFGGVFRGEKLSAANVPAHHPGHAKVTKGYDTMSYSHAENAPGLNECLVTIRNGVPNVHALVAEVHSVYCDEKQGLTTVHH